MNAGLIVSCFMKYIVANEVAKILDILVPINIIISSFIIKSKTYF